MGSAFLAGLQHPRTGFDQMAAMLMVGLWAGIALPRHIGAPPLAFIACMLAGFGWAAAGGAPPLAEGMIATSLVVLGLAFRFAVRGSEERRVGNAGVRTCRHRWSPAPEKEYRIPPLKPT